MSDSEPLVVKQRPADVDTIEDQLLEHFIAARAALARGTEVTIEVSGTDLLGQGDVADAAVAAGLVGMMRALAIEGERPGWTINAVAKELETRAMSGRLIHEGRQHLGRLRS